MTRTSQALKRLGVAAIAVATIGAGVPALVAGAAQAATPTTNLNITPASQTAAAGTCLVYTVTATDQTGANPSDTPTVTVNLSTASNSTTPIAFCDTKFFTPGTPSNNGSATTPGTQTADFPTSRTSPTAAPTATFGVYSNGPQTVNIRATANGGLTQSNLATATYTAGGQTAAASIKDVTTGDTTTTAPGNQPFTLQVLDANGRPVPGVTVSYQITGSGPNASSATGSCAGNPTDNSGKVNCPVAVSKTGTDTFTFFVPQPAGSTNSVPTLSVTRTTYPTPASAGAANNVTITPKNAATAAGSNSPFTITVTDNKGTAVQGATVTVTIDSGPGRFLDNTRFTRVVTNGIGQATVTTTTFASETGTQVISADITPTFGGAVANTCSQPATPTTAAGNCRDTTSNVISAASASPSPSASASASSSPSSSTAPAGRQTLGLTIDTPVIEAGNQATLTVTGSANQDIQLECYTRPSTTFTPSHATTIDAAGDAKVFKLALGMNTRCFAEYVKNPLSGFSNQGVVNVRTVVSIFPVRNGFRDYTFQGHNLPKYAGQLITLYYESKNGTTRKGNVKTDATGIYHIPARFVGSGIFTFYVRTGQTLTNAAGESDHVSVSIH